MRGTAGLTSPGVRGFRPHLVPDLRQYRDQALAVLDLRGQPVPVLPAATAPRDESRREAAQLPEGGVFAPLRYDQIRELQAPIGLLRDGGVREALPAAEPAVYLLHEMRVPHAPAGDHDGRRPGRLGGAYRIVRGADVAGDQERHGHVRLQPLDDVVMRRPRVTLVLRPRMQGDGVHVRGLQLVDDLPEVHAPPAPPEADLRGDGDARLAFHAAHYLPALRGVAHEGGPRPAADHLRRRAAHVDVDEIDVRIRPQDGGGGRGEDLRVAAEQLHARRAAAGEPQVIQGPPLRMRHARGRDHLRHRRAYAERLHERAIGRRGVPRHGGEDDAPGHAHPADAP